MKKFNNVEEHFNAEELVHYESLTKREQRKMIARKYNELYENESVRWNSLSKAEKTRELVRSGVEAGIADAKKFLNDFTGKK